MRKLIALAILTLITGEALAQTTATLDSAMRLFGAERKPEALLLFKRIYAGTDDGLKQKATVRVSEYWADHKDSIKKEQASAEFGNMLIGYLRPLAEKQNASINEIYTIGIGFWGVLSTGTLRQEAQMQVLEMTLQALNTAGRGGHPAASYYMAQALRRYKRFNPALPYEEIYGWTEKAMTDRKSIQPVLELASDMGDAWYKKEVADTSRMVLEFALAVTLNNMPDSLHVLVNRIWQNSKKSFSGGEEKGFLDNAFKQLSNNANAKSRIAKAYAWHLLYKYFYEGSRQYSQETREKGRTKIADTIRMVYSTDAKALAILAGEFIAAAPPRDMYEYANMLEPDWLSAVQPPFSGTQAFYTGAVLSGKLYTNLLESESDISRFAVVIASAYNQRLKNVHEFCRKFFDTPEGYVKNEFEKVFLYTSSIDRMNIQRLRTLPAFAGSRAMKLHDMNADIIYLETFLLVNDVIPQEVDAIMKKLSALTPEEKSAMELRYIKDLESNLGLFRAVAGAVKNGVEVEFRDPFTGKVNKAKVYTGDEGGKKKDELLAQLRAFLGK